MSIETEVEYIKHLMQKLDVSIEKISQVSNDVGRLLAVHDERISQLERKADKKTDDIKEIQEKVAVQTKEILDKLDKLDDALSHKINTDIGDLKRQQNECYKDLSKTLDDLETRIDTIERWKWVVIGAVSIVGFVIGNITDILNILK